MVKRVSDVGRAIELGMSSNREASWREGSLNSMKFQEEIPAIAFGKKVIDDINNAIKEKDYAFSCFGGNIEFYDGFLRMHLKLENVLEDIKKSQVIHEVQVEFFVDEKTGDQCLRTSYVPKEYKKDSYYGELGYSKFGYEFIIPNALSYKKDDGTISTLRLKPAYSIETNLRTGEIINRECNMVSIFRGTKLNELYLKVFDGSKLQQPLRLFSSKKIITKGDLDRGSYRDIVFNEEDVDLSKISSKEVRSRRATIEKRLLELMGSIEIIHKYYTDKNRQKFAGVRTEVGRVSEGPKRSLKPSYLKETGKK